MNHNLYVNISLQRKSENCENSEVMKPQGKDENSLYGHVDLCNDHSRHVKERYH